MDRQPPWRRECHRAARAHETGDREEEEEEEEEEGWCCQNARGGLQRQRERTRVREGQGCKLNSFPRHARASPPEKFGAEKVETDSQTAEIASNCVGVSSFD